MEWTKKDLDKEAEELQPKFEEEMIVKGVKRGWPNGAAKMFDRMFDCKPCSRLSMS
ncbi:hypothetical protein [Oligoflexus tunisiensis]|uniref:hypothetical protein n=1 Tax=Oligoflexus tunisiensis TaxID=708132 RepID=UPI00159F343C|nr:hypothetical protein [Oligoflexus tunisiensis]